MILGLAKNRDSETPSYKNRDCETHISAKKTRLRDPWNSTKILRDPQFLKDHSPPLVKFWSTYESWQKKQKKKKFQKFPCKMFSNENWFLCNDHAHLARLVFRRAIWSEINCFRLDFLRCCKSKRRWNLEISVCSSRTRKKGKKTTRATASLINTACTNVPRFSQ